jgi:mRNA-degrading endonuclease RelE of RelBE toxin-antitoxin system
VIIKFNVESNEDAMFDIQSVSEFKRNTVDLTYGRKPHAYRVFMTVDDDAATVRVLHVRRRARQRPTAEELGGDVRVISRLQL